MRLALSLSAGNHCQVAPNKNLLSYLNMNFLQSETMKHYLNFIKTSRLNITDFNFNVQLPPTVVCMTSKPSLYQNLPHL